MFAQETNQMLASVMPPAPQQHATCQPYQPPEQHYPQTSPQFRTDRLSAYTGPGTFGQSGTFAQPGHYAQPGLSGTFPYPPNTGSPV